MELRHLRYFVATAEEANIGRAAQRLHISQPPLTRQIAQLEQELGTALFVRTRKGVELTDAGRAYLTDARHVLQLTERAGERARRAGLGEVGHLDIAIFGTSIFGVIPRLLRACRDQHPDVEVTLHNMNKAQQVEALTERRIDVAFNRLVPAQPGLVAEVLLYEPIFAAVPVSHPLAAHTGIHLAELRHQPLVLFPTGSRPSFIDLVLGLCSRAGFRPEVAVEVADVVHGIALVATGRGLSLVPQSATNLHVPGVTFLRIDDRPRPQVDVACIYRDDDPSPVLHRMLTTMRATALELSRDPSDHPSEI